VRKRVCVRERERERERERGESLLALGIALPDLVNPEP